MAHLRRFRGRDIHGILLLDKPLGISSNDALQQTKRLANARKAGHTGSLDPLATGMLPICFGEATKFSQFLLDADKRYVVTIKLGEKTKTGDTEGEIIERKPIDGVTKESLAKVLEDFKGESMQIPPMYSALKHEGQPLYKIAREQGIEVEREPRPINLFSLALLEFQGDEISLRVHCSKGTYIRTLAEDIGEALGTCAHVTVLRREAVAGYDAAQMITLPELEALREHGVGAIDRYILPVNTCVAAFPKVRLSETGADALKHGQAIGVAPEATPGFMQLFTPDDVFFGIGEVTEDHELVAKRLVADRSFSEFPAD